jgi:hypothetical protein
MWLSFFREVKSHTLSPVREDAHGERQQTIELSSYRVLA